MGVLAIWSGAVRRFLGEFNNMVTTGSVTPLPADLVLAYGLKFGYGAWPLLETNVTNVW